MAKNESEINIGMNIEANTAPLNQGLSKAEQALKGVAASAEKIPQNIEKAAKSSEQLVESTKRRQKAEKGVTQEVNKQGRVRKKSVDTSKKITDASEQVVKKTKEEIALENKKLSIKQKELEIARLQAKKELEIVKANKSFQKEYQKIDNRNSRSKERNSKANLISAETKRDVSSPAYRDMVQMEKENQSYKNELRQAKTELAYARKKQIEAGLGSRFTQNWRGGIAAAISGLSTRAKGKSGLTGMLARYGEQSWNKNRVMKSGTMNGKGVGLGAIKGFIVGDAFSKLGKAIVSLSESALKAYGSIEKLKISLGVVFGSETQANTAFQGIKEYAVKSPFGAEQTTEMAVLLKQSGVYGYELLDTLKMIGDVSGGNEEKMKRIANNYAQIASIGKASMLDMRQFAYAGIPIYKAVAEELGVSQQVLRNMIADGKVTNDVMEKVFKNLTSESGMFYKATEKGSEALNARLTNLKDAATFALGGAGQFLMNIGNLKGEGGLITEVIGITENILQYLEKSVSTLNLEKTVKQIEKNDSEQARLQMLIDASKDNPELKQYLEAQLAELRTFISPEEKLATESQIYSMERKRLEGGLPKEVFKEGLEDVLKKEYDAIGLLDSLRFQQQQAVMLGDYEQASMLETQIENQKLVVELASEEVELYRKQEKLKENIAKQTLAIAENEAKYGLSASYVAAQNFTTTQMEMLSKSSDKATGLSVIAGNAVLAWEQNTEEGQKQKKEREDKEYAENYKKFTEYKKALTESGDLIQGFKGSLSDFYEILQSGIIKPLETIDVTKLAEESARNEKEVKSRDEQWEHIAKGISNVKNTFSGELSADELDKLSRMSFILSQDNNQANVDAFARIFRGFTEDLEKSGNKELAAAIGQALVLVKEIPDWMPKTNPETSGKGKDSIPELWKRIVGSATGIDASFITGGAKSFFDMYRSTFENRNLAQGGISGMTAAGKSAAEISTMLRYSGKKAKDGTLQIDWEATAEVMKDFMLSGRASVKELEEYSKAIESQISVYDKLKETMFTTGEDWANIDPKVLEEQLVNAFSGVGASLIAVNEAGQTKEVEARDGQLYFKGTKDLVYAQNEYKMSMEKSIDAIDEASKSLKELSLRADNAKNAKDFASSLITDRDKAVLQTSLAEGSIYNYMTKGSSQPNMTGFAAAFLEQYNLQKQDEGLMTAMEGLAALADFNKRMLSHSVGITPQSPADFKSAKDAIDKMPKGSAREKAQSYLEKGLSGLIYDSLINGTEEWKKYIDTLGYVYTGSDLSKEEQKTQKATEKAEQRTALSERFKENERYFKERQRMSGEIKEKEQGAFANQEYFKSMTEPLKQTLLQLSTDIEGISLEEGLRLIKDDFEKQRAELSKYDWQGRADLNMTEGATTGNLGQFTEGALVNAGLSLAQGTDVGAFAQGMAMGGPMVGLVNMLINSLSNIIGGMDILGYALNPVTNLLKGLAPLIKLNMVPLAALSQILEKAGEGISKAINWIFGLFGFTEEDIDEYFNSLTGANDELEKQAELLKTLNSQFEETLKLFKEAQDYYLTEKRHLNAQTAIQMQGMSTKKVNDMILTPHGNFSTAPDDYLLAMKDPTSLMGYGGQNVAVQTTVSVKVINQAGDTVRASATETTNDKGQKELVVMISKAIANDYASGRNGWDSAIGYRNQRANGRRY